MQRIYPNIFHIPELYFSENIVVSAEKRLIKHLIKRYEETGVVGRPVHNTSVTLNVGFGIGLIQILDLNEKSQMLTTNVWCRYVSPWIIVINVTWSPTLLGTSRVRVSGIQSSSSDYRPFSSKINQVMDGCFSTAWGRQPTFSDTRDVSFSHSDASISRKTVSIRWLSIQYPWECWSEFLVAGCPSSHKSAGIREDMLESGELFSGSWISASVPYVMINKYYWLLQESCRCKLILFGFLRSSQSINTCLGCISHGIKIIRSTKYSFILLSSVECCYSFPPLV